MSLGKERKTTQKGFNRQKKRRSQVRRPQPTSRATYADLLTIGALFIALILLVTLGFQWALP